MLTSSKKWPMLVGALAILASEFLLRNVFLPMPFSPRQVALIAVLEWLVLLLLVEFWLPKMEGQTLESLGWGKWQWRYLWLGAGGFVLAFIASALLGWALEAAGLGSLRTLQPMLKHLDPLTLFSLFLTSTILEEILYRGYLIERLNALTGKLWLAALISGIAFVLVHWKFFGLGAMLNVSAISAALTLLYLKERSLWPCMVLHGLNNLLAFLIFPLLIS